MVDIVVKITRGGLKIINTKLKINNQDENISKQEQECYENIVNNDDGDVHTNTAYESS